MRMSHVAVAGLASRRAVSMSVSMISVMRRALAPMLTSAAVYPEEVRSRRRASSVSAWMRASGVRSSCEISAEKRCSWRSAAAIRSSRSSSVAPAASARRAAAAELEASIEVVLAPVGRLGGHPRNRPKRTRRIHPVETAKMTATATARTSRSQRARASGSRCRDPARRRRRPFPPSGRASTTGDGQQPRVVLARHIVDAARLRAASRARRSTAAARGGRSRHGGRRRPRPGSRAPRRRRPRVHDRPPCDPDRRQLGVARGALSSESRRDASRWPSRELKPVSRARTARARRRRRPQPATAAHPETAHRRE